MQNIQGQHQFVHSLQNNENYTLIQKHLVTKYEDPRAMASQVKKV